MAQVTFFHYIHKDTVLHRMDGRLKLLGMLAFSIGASLATLWWHFTLLFSIGIIGIAAARLPIKSLLRDMRFFSVIILLVLAADTFAIEGDPLPGISGASIQGLLTGVLFAGRLIAILLICTVMTGTTPLRLFSDIIEWFLRPVPFIPEARAATMINMTFILIPVIFDTYSEMMNAQKARGIENRKNPVRRLKYIVFPLLTESLRRADEMVYAMEARCYTEDRTRPKFKNHLIDWLLFLICVILLLIIILTR